MKIQNRLAAACFAGCAAVSSFCAAASDDSAAGVYHPGEGLMLSGKSGSIEKALSTQSLGARGTVTSTATLSGGFQMNAAGTVYILVRGNSLGTLGITQGYLDAPRVRVYNAQGVDLITDLNGNNGFNSCLSGNSFNAPVWNYYNTVRAAPAADRDGCVAMNLGAGVYTFSVTPSIPGVTTVSTQSVPTFGEVLFEVTLGP